MRQQLSLEKLARRPGVQCPLGCPEPSEPRVGGCRAKGGPASLQTKPTLAKQGQPPTLTRHRDRGSSLTCLASSQPQASSFPEKTLENTQGQKDSFSVKSPTYSRQLGFLHSLKPTAPGAPAWQQVQSRLSIPQGPPARPTDGWGHTHTHLR